jgi:hypothetical protein
MEFEKIFGIAVAAFIALGTLYMLVIYPYIVKPLFGKKVKA